MAYLTQENVKLGLRIRCVHRGIPSYRREGVVFDVGGGHDDALGPACWYFKFTNQYLFEIIDEEKLVLNQKLVCSDCKQRAPHVQPVYKVEYICASCKVMRELGSS